MSRAFLREDDLETEPVRTLSSPLPPGAKNYLTVEGAERLRHELSELLEKRAGLLANNADPDAKRELQMLEQRIRYLQQSLHSAEIAPVSTDQPDQVRFGSTVFVREPDGVESKYRIVGVDEARADVGDVSWLSPLAQALLNAHRGDRVRFKAPRREIELEIVHIQ